MHTEEQAKTKWCPFARQPLDIRENDDFCIPGNRAQYTGSGPFPKGSCCIASECMIWRWDTALNDQLLEDARAKFRDDPEIVEPLKDTQLYQDFLESRHGYCGLAGKSDDR